jgi:hypothetical protein
MLLNFAAGLVVAAFGLFLIALAAACVFQRRFAERFLSKFASSAKVHFTEQILRVIAGAALIIISPSMWFSTFFWLFGWILVVTSVGLMLVPWKWHREYAKWTVPWAIRRMWLFALGAFGLGALLYYGLSRTLT